MKMHQITNSKSKGLFIYKGNELHKHLKYSRLNYHINVFEIWGVDMLAIEKPTKIGDSLIDWLIDWFVTSVSLFQTFLQVVWHNVRRFWDFCIAIPKIHPLPHHHHPTSPAFRYFDKEAVHYSDVIMDTMASQITSLTIVHWNVYSGADQRKYQIAASLAFAGNSPVTGEFPAQRASNAESVPIWWRHHVISTLSTSAAKGVLFVEVFIDSKQFD